MIGTYFMKRTQLSIFDEFENYALKENYFLMFNTYRYCKKASTFRSSRNY